MGVMKADTRTLDYNNVGCSQSYGLFLVKDYNIDYIMALNI